MSLSRLDVDTSLLKWAMERSNKSVSELSGKSNLKKLNAWLEGTRKPTHSQLEAFAKATYTPFGYLLLPKPPREQSLPMPHFRTMSNISSSKRSINHEDTIKIIAQRQEWVRDYLVNTGAEPLEFVRSSTIHDKPVDVANKIKKTLKMSSEWSASQPKWEDATKHIEEQMEEAGIFVSKNSIVQNNTSRPLDLEEFRGFVLVDDYAPFVFVNVKDIKAAQMFTLAHELAHIWLGESASFDLQYLAPNKKNKLELACNKIAAEFLVPTEEIRQYWNRFSRDSDPYKAISEYFKVSLIVAARRARDTDCISENQFKKFYSNYIESALLQREKDRKLRDQKKKSGPSYYNTAISRVGKRFLRTVFTAVGENRLLYRDAYNLTSLKPRAFSEMTKKVGGV